MSNSTYSKKTIFYIITFGFITALFIVFHIYGFVLEAFSTNIILNIRTDYKSRIATEEIININDIISSEDRRILNSYNCHIQPLFTKYEYFDKLNPYFPIKNIGVPYTFQGINFAESNIKPNDISIKNSIILTHNKLKYDAPTVWTPIDCWSWRNSYKNRYGLISLNIHTQVKTLKKSAYWYKNLTDSSLLQVPDSILEKYNQ